MCKENLIFSEHHLTPRSKGGRGKDKKTVPQQTFGMAYFGKRCFTGKSGGDIKSLDKEQFQIFCNNERRIDPQNSARNQPLA